MKPQPIAPNYQAFPPELRSLPIWLLWQYRLNEKQKWTKIPLVADGSGKWAKTNEPNTWRSFDDAMKFVVRGDGAGIRIQEPYCGIDLDKCRDKTTGVIADWAQKLVDRFDSYTEISPSGEGLHIILELAGTLPEDGCRERGGKDQGWEIGIYDKTSPRYFTVTGQIVEDRDVIATVGPNDFYAEFARGDWDVTKARSNGKSNGTRIIDKKASLLGGQWEGLYPSQSEADSALVWYLADEYGDDPAAIDREFRKSGLMRLKWDERQARGTYGSITIFKCLKKRRQAAEKPNLILNDEGSARPVLANAIALLRNEPEWQGVLAYNEFSLYTTTKKTVPWQTKPGANWSDYDDSRTCEWLQHRGALINSKVAGEAVQVVAHENVFHPVKDYLAALQWDQTPRIDQWLSTYLGAKDTEYTRAVGACWMLSAVARIYQPGCQCDYTLLLEGAQGDQKSSALRTLAVSPSWFVDHTSALGTKDSRLELHGKWIVEFSEFDGVRRGDLTQIKAYLVTRIDHIRLPYGRRAEDIPRSNVFCASTNNKNSLVDETGNRRFWPVACGTIKQDLIVADRDQLWAEAYLRYRAGAKWWLTAKLEKAAAEEQEERYDAGVWDEVIGDWLEDPTQAYSPDGDRGALIPVTPFDSTKERVAVLDVLLHAVKKPLDKCTQADKNTAVRCLVHLGWKQKQERSGPHKGRRFYWPGLK